MLFWVHLFYREFHLITGCFAIVGDPNAPPHIVAILRQIALGLCRNGWTLRSGHTSEVDVEAEEAVVDLLNAAPEVYIPHKGAYMSKSHYFYTEGHVWDIAAQNVEHWASMSESVKKYYCCRVFEVLGMSLRLPSELILAWTPDAKTTPRVAVAEKMAPTIGAEYINLGGQDISNVAKVNAYLQQGIIAPGLDRLNLMRNMWAIGADGKKIFV